MNVNKVQLESIITWKSLFYNF